MTQKQYIIGIDGGGTKTQAILAERDGTVIDSASAGASNPQVVGFEQSAQVLNGLIRECCSKAGIDESKLLSIVAGIAGIGRETDRIQLKSALTDLGAYEQIRLETDARIALEAALPWRAGIVVVAGTGSIAFYRTESKGIHRAGGWGRILGDEGSGFAIARDALKEILKWHEGRGEETALIQAAKEYFHIESVSDIISAVKAHGGEIAPFAQQVIDAASRNDAVAVEVLRRNVYELAVLIHSLLKKHPPKTRLSLALVGGLVERDTFYSIMLRNVINESFSQLYVQKPKFPPAYGALILALDSFTQ